MYENNNDSLQIMEQLKEVLFLSKELSKAHKDIIRSMHNNREFDLGRKNQIIILEKVT